MDQTTKITFQGKTVEATRIPVTTSQEGWAEHVLADGTILRVKVVISDVFRIHDVYDADGNPIYQVRSMNLVSAQPPEHLRKIRG